jgi:UDP-2-acetamido-2-deoxy-ribo-hexuluronate aminotransferase
LSSSSPSLASVAANDPAPERIGLLDLKPQYLRLKPRIEEAVRRVLDSGQYILGPEVAELEDTLAAFTGSGHAVCVANGTDALWIGLAAEGIGPGDAVFVPSFTFVATAEAVVNNGAVPVFVDVDEATYTMDPSHLAEQIAKVKRQGSLRPRAVIPVDLFGLPADYDAILEAAAADGLFVMADAAQSFGGVRNGTRVGALTPATATSFYPSKPLACYGDGGCLFTTDAAHADAYRALRHHGAIGPNAARVGVNSRLDTVQAAILLLKLEIYEEERAAREQAARWYDTHLPPAVARQALPDGAESAWAHYCIVAPDREAIARTLNDAGIDSRIYYASPVHLLPAFLRFSGGEGSLPATEKLSRHLLALPLHPYLDEATVVRVCRTVEAAL